MCPIGAGLETLDGWNALGSVGSKFGKLFLKRSRDQVIKCLHIGVLSVQDNPAERPTMASIVLMLNNHSVTLPSLPRQPVYFLNSRTRQKPLNEQE